MRRDDVPKTNPMLRVLQFVADGSPGGGTTHVRQLLYGLRTEFESAVLTQYNSSLYRMSQEAGFRTYGGDFFAGRLSRIDPRCVRPIRDAVRDFRPDIVHCHGGRAAFFRSLLSKKTWVVYTAHGLHYSRKPNFVSRTMGRIGERWACRRVDRALYVCEHDATVARTDRLLPPATPANVIYPAIAAHAHNRAAGNGRPFTVGFIGRLVEQKNPRLFVEVMKQLPDTQGVLGGGGPLHDSIKQEIARNGMSSRIEMTGDLAHDDVLHVLGRIDLLVMTSLWEGLPALLLEAMYFGVPVVSVPVGGVPEIVEHGRTGLLSAGTEAAQLAALVRQLRDDPDKRSAIAACARNQVQGKFLESHMVESIAVVYRELLASNSANRTRATSLATST
jgi:glycosyltransferase involved in cell wall biosynthesis